MRQQEISPEYYRQAEQIAQDVLQFLTQNHGIQPREYPESGLIMVFGKNDLRQFAFRQRSEIKDHLLRADMDRSMLFSWIEGRRAQKFHVVIYLADPDVCNAVDGTFADRDVFVEEISHAFFSK